MTEPNIHVNNCSCQTCRSLREMVAANKQFIEKSLSEDPHDIAVCRCGECRAIIAGLTKRLGDSEALPGTH